MAEQAARAMEYGFGRFELRRAVGEGAVGVVYEAYDREYEARVALKALKAVGPESVVSLKNEFRSLQGIVHPNVIRLFELLEYDGQWCLTMEFVDGTDVLRYLGTGARDAMKIRRTFAQLCDALQCLHAAGRVHRDVKPSNVFVDDTGRVVLLDLGIAFDLNAVSRADRGPVGTIAYMAPEQASGERVGPAADAYSVGVMLYEVLTGRPPFAGQGWELVEQKLTSTPLPPSQVAHDVAPDLSELCMRLLSQVPEDRPRLDAAAAILGGVASMRGVPSISPPASSDASFFGRQLELRQLRAEFDFVSRQREPVIVVIEGESGVGKSALVREFVERLTVDVPNILCLSGRCYEREWVPFKAFDHGLDMLADYLDHLPEDERNRLLPADFGQLARIFPAMGAITSEQRPAEDGIRNPQELRARMFAVLRELIARVAEKCPLVFCIDDLQWADEDSILMLTELTRTPHAPALLVVTTRRPSADPLDPRIAEGGVRVSQLDLTKLDESDALALAARLFTQPGTTPEDQALRAIVREANGHPLFIAELVRRSIVSEVLGAPKLDDALWLRVGGLGADERRMLELLAVAGAPISASVAALATALTMGRVLSTAAILSTHQLARSTGPLPRGKLEPFHDRVRESVLAHLETAVRVNWHRCIAEAIESAETADVESLAMHWAGAGDSAKASHYAAQGAAAAMRALAFDRAAQLYESALVASSWTRSETAKLRLGLAGALSAAGRGAQAADVLLLEADMTEPREGALDLRRRASELLLCSGHFERGLALVRACLQAVGERFPASPGTALLLLLWTRLLLRLRGLSAKKTAAPRPELLSRIDTLATAGAGFAMTDSIRGSYFQSKNLGLALDAGDPLRLVRTLQMETCFTSSGGTKSESRARFLLDELKRHADAIGGDEALGGTALAEGYCHYMTGRWALAREALGRAEEILRARVIGATFLANSALFMLMRALVYLGDARELNRRLPQAVRDAKERRDAYTVSNLLSIPTSFTALANDEPEAGIQALDEAERPLSRQAFLLQHFFCIHARCQVEAYLGDPERALSRLTAALPLMRRAMILRVQTIHVATLEQQSRLALACGHAAALATAQKGAATLQKMAPAWAKASGDLLAGCVARREQRRHEATALFERAVTSFESIPMPLHAAVTRVCHGRLLSGPSGLEVQERGESWLREAGFRQPERMVTLLAP